MKHVYDFKEGQANMKEILGGKGANLAEMTRLGLPVPQGFTISTAACMAYLNNHNQFDEELKAEIAAALTRLEQETQKSFNDPKHLLLVSVRSGAAISMPGMMDTILNLGLNDTNVQAFAQLTNEAFAYDCYRRLLQMFGSVVYNIDDALFSRALEDAEMMARKPVIEFNKSEFLTLIDQFKAAYQTVNRSFPQDPYIQLEEAIQAVFNSWNNHRAFVYRNLHQISHTAGTAVNVQSMVFGNAGVTSGTGVAFSRNPVDGTPHLYGEFLLNAQGEDIVAGIRTPQKIAQLADEMPEIYQQFETIAKTLEAHYCDMQDIEFTIENRKLYILQTRNGKRTPKAAVRVAVDLVNEGLIDSKEALLRIEPNMFNQLLHPIFEQQQIDKATVIAKGLAASPGAACGEIVFTAEHAKQLADEGHQVILVRQETSPEDIEGMLVSQAIVTSRGGLTSHAAVVARGLGACCVVGCEAITVYEAKKQMVVNGQTFEEGQVISVNGNTGEIYLGEIPTTVANTDSYFDQLMVWADQHARLKVKANAETLRDLSTALKFDAVGVGLARTEHMFFAEERLIEIRRLILAETPEEKTLAIQNLLGFQTEDFYQMFKLTQDKPMIIRLLDPPMHEFLPGQANIIEEVSRDLNKPIANIEAKIKQLHENNPMLGHRGCRLGITDPAIYQMQAEAIMRAAIRLNQEGIQVAPEIMIPLVGSAEELAQVIQSLRQRIEAIFEETATTIPYLLGTMIELPRACLIADELAKQVDFFSFGTNDLTQMTFGFSRDDMAKFLDAYLEKGLLAHDPFQSIDVHGVGQLIRMAVEKARQTNPSISIGICGEVGGDPASIHFFNQLAIDYVSCSPFRVPIARLSAAQAQIKEDQTTGNTGK